MLFWTTAAAALIAPAWCQKVIDLSGTEWTVSNPSLNVSVPGSLSSNAHLDLFAAEVTGDPYHGLNEFNLRWICETNWTYMSAPIEGLNPNSKSTWLLFNGLDTFTSIDFCGQHVAATNNQFRQYYFDVSSILSNCSADPVLSINFGSAPNIADNIAAEPGQETWPDLNIQYNYEFPNRWFIRKEQNDFGWDWSPGFAPAGPWQPAYIIQIDSSQVVVRNSLVDIYRMGQMNNLPPDQTQPWVVNVSIDYLGSLPAGASMSYELSDCSNASVSSGTLENVNVTDSTISASIVISDDMVELWWPNGFGAQTLYYLKVNVQTGQDSLAEIEKRVGFRTIVLNQGNITQEQLDQGIAPGANWHFEINGQEFYAKGSNFIPPDAFWPRVTEDRMRRLLQSVVDGRQNMLRLWASGAYSPDFMYEIADEMGILLWSEFEFGDAMYPVDDEFIANVADEVNYQTRRVNHHPSLAFWAGNNEIESWQLNSISSYAPAEFARYKAEYEKLFLDTIVPILFGNSRSISYSPSSTTNGYTSLDFSTPPYFTERYYNTTPGSFYGTAEYYNYDAASAFNISAYPINRFANEFGFHSMPSIQTWRQAVDESDLQFNSSVIMLRNHHPPPNTLNTSDFATSAIGMGQMTIAAQMWYPVPDKVDPIANFSSWCYTTQVFQADYYRSLIQFFRRGSGSAERQLGSLYWQLEDLWQAPTFAGIEYDGRWKVLHYAARDVYQNVIISPFVNGTTGEFTVFVTSDLWSPAEGTASLVWYDWSGNKVSDDGSMTASTTVTVGAINSTQIYSADLNSTLAGHDKRNIVLTLEVSVQGQLPNSNSPSTFTHQNFYHASPLSQAQLVDPGLQLSYSASSGTFAVEATSGIAAWVWLDYPAGAVVTFSDNGFWLMPGVQKEVGFTVKMDSTAGGWIGGVTVSSLWDNTTP